MKKMLAVLVLTGLFAAGCVKPYMLLSSGTPLSNYSAIHVVVDATRFLKNKEGDPHYDGYAKSCQDMRNVITKRIDNWLAANFQGKAGAPAATLTVTVDDFHTGSGAARFFLGDAANGHLDVSCEITGGHLFRVHAVIEGIGMDKLASYMHVASSSESYIKDHL